MDHIAKEMPSMPTLKKFESCANALWNFRPNSIPELNCMKHVTMKRVGWEFFALLVSNPSLQVPTWRVGMSGGEYLR